MRCRRTRNSGLGVWKKKKGFTLIELLVSVGVLLVITSTVALNLNKTRMREELEASARQIASTLRDLQAQALSARAVKTCKPASVAIVCELGTGLCGGASCSTNLVPMAVGMTLASGASFFSTFADVDVALDNRRQDAAGRETLARTNLASVKAGSAPVTVTSLVAGGPLTTVAVAFERQNGNMRIQACGSPPLAPACGGGGEPITLDITLTHVRLGKSLIVKLNRITGKISIE